MHTRRAVLAATPALPVLAAAAAQGRPVRAHPDAQLLALCERHAEATRRHDEAAQAAQAAEEAAAPFRPRLPEAFKVRAGDWFRMLESTEPGRFHTVVAVERWQVALNAGHYRLAMSPARADVFKARGGELVAALGAHRRAVKAVEAAHGVRAAVVRANRADRTLYAIEARLLDTRATTLDGLRAKARVVAGLIGEPDKTYEDRATRALLADLLAKGAPASLREAPAAS